MIGFRTVVRKNIAASKVATTSQPVMVTLNLKTLNQIASVFGGHLTAAKGAVEGLVRSLAAELSPTIRVNGIAPSLTDTPLAENLLNSEAKRQASADRHPLKRVGDPAETARVVDALLGPATGFMTGQILKIDGGLSSVKLLS